MRTPPAVAPLTVAVLLAAMVVVGCAPSVAPSSSVAPPASLVVASSSPTGSPAAPSLSSSAASTSSPPPTGTPSPAPTAAPTATPVPTLVPTTEPTDPPPVAEFPQTWTGSWEDPVTGGTGAMTLVLTGKGDAFGGTIAMDGTGCLVDGILVGAYDGRDITFVVTQRGTVLEFEGDGDAAAIDGTFRSECDGMDGTWTVDRTDR